MGQKNTKETENDKEDIDFEATQNEKENQIQNKYVQLVINEEDLVPQIENALLVKNIEVSIEKFENELYKAVEGKPFENFLKNEAMKICQSLKSEIKNVLSENRQLNVVLIGPSSWGKTTLMRALERNIFEEPLKTTDEDAKWTEFNQNLCVLDTCGYDEKKKLTTLENNLEVKVPDIAIVILSAHDLRTWSNKKSEIETALKTVFKYAKKAKSTLPSINQTGKSLPVVWVISKMDIAASELNCRWRREQTFDEWKNSLRDSEEVIQTIKSQMECFDKDIFSPDEDIINLAAIQGGYSLGLEQLRDIISINSPLNTVIATNNKKRYESRRRAMAMKIIASFSGIAGLVTVLPFLDIPLSMLINKNMLLILEILRTNPEKSAKKFENQFAITLGVSYATRIAILGVCSLFKMTIVGAAVAIPVGATAASSTTMAIGIHAYNYFTDDKEET